MTDTMSPEVSSPNEPTGASRWRRAGENVVLYILSISGALLISGLLVAMTGNSWQKVLQALLDGAFLAPGRWGDTLTVAAPMLLVALGMVVGVKAGLFNIGQEGQLLMGAMGMAFVGTRMSGPGVLLLVAGLSLGILAGGAYAGIAALMRFRRGVPEVISTLLLVFIAFQLLGFAITTSWLLQDSDPNRPNKAVTSAPMPESVRLPIIRVFGNEFSLGFVIALVLAIVLAFVLARTVWGFRLRLLGFNVNVAQKVGIAARKTGSLALMISGGMAGLAGATMLAGGASNYRLTTGFSTNIGWQGLLVALLARSNPVAAIPMAILFAALRTGSGFLASTGVDRKIVDVVQALLVLAILLPPAIQLVRSHRRARAAAKQEAAA